MNKPLGQSMIEASVHCVKLREPITAVYQLPVEEIDEFNGLRDAEAGNVCQEGMSEMYYQGYSYGYRELS